MLSTFPVLNQSQSVEHLPQQSVLSRYFRPRAIAESVVWLLALFLLNKAGSPGALVFLLILLRIAATSTSGALKALAVIGLGVQLNQFFVPKSLVWGPGRLVLTMLCVVRMLGDALGSSRIPMPPAVVALTFYCVVAGACSLLSGYYFHIAFLKLVNFWSGAAAIMLGTEVLRRRGVDMTQWFVSLIYVIVAMGIASITLGQSRNFMNWKIGLEAPAHSLFNGAFLHPNCHSAIAAPAAVFCLAATIFGKYRNRWVTAAAAAVLFLFMALSQSRSSLAAAFTGAAVLVYYARPIRSFKRGALRVNVRRGKILAFAMLAVVALAAVDIATGGNISTQIVSFVNKGGKSDVIDADLVIKSREGKISESWNNFLESPIYGIGFQVAKTEYFRNNATLFTAPVEKGFLPTAVLEEGGIVGATAFAIFLIIFIASLVRSRNVPAMAVGATLLVSTIPEVSIFAMGGSATYMWSLMGAAMIMGDHCWIQKPIIRRFQ